MKNNLIYYNPITAGSRNLILVNKRHLWKDGPVKSLCEKLKKTGGRNNQGKITCRHRGGGARRIYRKIDFIRNKTGIATVERIEYDPNRSAFIALIRYEDNTLSYIIAPDGLGVGMKVESAVSTTNSVGNSCALSNIKVGTLIHNIELQPGKGAKMARSAGCKVILAGKEVGFAILQLPSGKQKKVSLDCRASIGIVSNIDHMNEVLGKAGRNRHRGWRPEVRGIAMNPVDHPHGGRTNGGMNWTNHTGRIRKGQKTVRRKK